MLIYIKSEIRCYEFNEWHTFGMWNFICIVIVTMGQIFVFVDCNLTNSLYPRMGESLWKKQHGL
jgi:hypothetical protein